MICNVSFIAGGGPPEGQSKKKGAFSATFGPQKMRQLHKRAAASEFMRQTMPAPLTESRQISSV